MAKATFEESQRFSRWWLGLLVGGMVAGMAAALSDPDPNKYWGMVLVFVISGGVSLLIARVRLLTRIDGYGIHYRFTGFMGWKQIAWAEIDKAELRTYNAITEYGGWGYRRRWFKSGLALTVGGDRGIQLQLLNGKRILLGTHQPEEAAAALARFGGRKA